MAATCRIGFVLSLILAVASAFIPAPITSSRTARLEALRVQAVKEVKSPAEFDGVSDEVEGSLCISPPCLTENIWVL